MIQCTLATVASGFLLLGACSSGGGGGQSDGGPDGAGGSGNCSAASPTEFPDSEIACSCSEISAGGDCTDIGPTANCSAYQGQVDAGNACPGGTFTLGMACPTASRVGTCYFGLNSADRYYSPNYTTATAQSLCTSVHGCFVAN